MTRHPTAVFVLRRCGITSGHLVYPATKCFRMKRWISDLFAGLREPTQRLEFCSEQHSMEHTEPSLGTLA